MKRPAVNFLPWVAVWLVVSVIASWPTMAHAQRRGKRPARPAPVAAPPPAQEKAPEPAAAPAEPAAAEKPAEPAKEEATAPASDDLKLPPEPDLSGGQGGKATPTMSWQDIVVVPRKSFLKGGRLELAPFTGVSINDLLINHYVFGVNLNYFLTDVFSIGLQGQYFMKALTEREELTGLQYNRVPSLNRYLYGASLNFGYVPVYGKFSLFNRAIMSWEIYASAGFGWTRSEIIPRSYAAEKFTNELLTPNAAVGARFFLFNWLTVNFEVRDYIMADKFENKNRVKGTSGADAKANAEQALVNNVMLMAGVGIYLPGGFQYKTAR